MIFGAAAVLALSASTASAHVRLLYPEPRGVFNSELEPTFCGGYSNAASNRSTFPVTNGIFSIQTNHPGWVAGVLISTDQNPNSFDNFKVNGEDQLARNFAREEGAGTFCIPLDISAAKVPGAVAGANVTIQILFEGGDGPLYQCADLTLTNSTVNTTCTNSTSTGDSDHDSDDHDDDHDHDGEEGNGSGSIPQVQQLSGFVAGVAGLFALIAVSL